MARPEWSERGHRFELLERAEWSSGKLGPVSFEELLTLESGRRGRADIVLDEPDGARTIIEVKASDWDSMAPHRVRPNALRHARQVLGYGFPYWDGMIDVIPAIVYPRAPKSAERRREVEDILNERNIQVVWYAERDPNRPT